MPLSTQAVWLLKKQPFIADGAVFASTRSGKRPPHPSTPLDLLKRRFGDGFCLHGMRSTFRDWTAESGMDMTASEKCLMHSVGSRVVQAYLRTDMLEQRRPIMQAWADTILPMETLEKVFPGAV